LREVIGRIADHPINRLPGLRRLGTWSNGPVAEQSIYRPGITCLKQAPIDVLR
jgi:hypothetical protein